MVNRSPRVVLVARQFEARTQSALDFLRENGLPVAVVPVSVYEDADGRRIVDIEGDHQPSLEESVVTEGDAKRRQVSVLVDGRRATVGDLLAAGLIDDGEELEFVRPRLGVTYRAVVISDGRIQTEDGEIWPSPSRAAMSAANVESYDGWHAWRVPRLGGVKLDQLRRGMVAAQTLVPEDPDT